MELNRGPVVIAEITGGLGNQLFQYAAGRALADRLGVELMLDTSSYRRNTYRNFNLLEFRIRGRIVRGVESFKLGVDSAIGKRYLKNFVAMSFGHLPLAVKVISEVDHEFVELPNKISQSTYLRGYWQNVRYFADDVDRICDDLRVREIPSARLDFASDLRQINSVAVHIRRTDYLTFRYHVCGSDYYQRAIRKICSQIPNPHLFFFSDDINWVRDNIQFELPATYIEPDIGHPALDLWMMSQCRHRVLGNSSFSWWSAWLAEDPSGIVIAPEIWLRGKENWSPALPHWTLVGNDAELLKISA